MIILTALLSQPPGAAQRCSKLIFPCRGIFYNPRFCLQGTGYKHHRIITALIFPRNLFTPCMKLNLVLKPSPTYICKAGNSLLPPTLTILVPPGQTLALRIDDSGEITIFICFFFNRFLPLQNVERNFKVSSEEITS